MQNLLEKYIGEYLMIEHFIPVIICCTDWVFFSRLRIINQTSWKSKQVTRKEQKIPTPLWIIILHFVAMYIKNRFVNECPRQMLKKVKRSPKYNFATIINKTFVVIDYKKWEGIIGQAGTAWKKARWIC